MTSRLTSTALSLALTLGSGLGLGLAWAAPLRAAAVPLEVVQRAPEGALDSVEAGKEVVITFNRPMVALGSGEDNAAFCPCKISPSLAGRCRWRGTNTVAFEFSPPPGPGHSFEVLVPKGTRSQVGGDELADDVRFLFTTLQPRVVGVYPGDQSRWLGRQPAFFVAYNVRVKAAAAAGHARLSSPEGDVPLDCVEHSVADLRKARLKGRYADVPLWWWGASGQVLELKPRSPLKTATHYTLVLKQGWPAEGGEEGAAGSAQDATYGYDTYGPFTALGVEAYSECSTRARLALSNPVLEERLGDYVKVSPAVTVDAWNSDEPRYSGGAGRFGDGTPAWDLPLAGWHFAPETSYHFTIAPGLKDVFGDALDQAAEFDWTAPSLCADLDARGGFGVMESYAPARHPMDATNEKAVTVRTKSVPPAEAVDAYQAWSGAEAQPKTFEGGRETSWEVPVTPNVKAHSYVDLARLLGQDLGSFTLLGVKVPGAKGSQESWITAFDDRTDLGLTLKSSPDNCLLWTTDLRLGTSRAGIPVELRDAGNKVLWKGVSDADGLARAPGWRGLGLKDWKRWEAPQVFALAYSPNGAALLDSRYHEGIDPWRFRLPYGGYEVAQSTAPRRTLLFADRGVYRPGEAVHFKGWVRELSAGDWAVPAALHSLALEVKDSRDRQVLTATVKVGGNGGFEFAFPLAKDAPTGTWTLDQVRGKAATGRDQASDEDPPDNAAFSESFRVEAVKAASYEVSLQGPQAWVRLGDPLAASVQGRYLAGAGMPGAEGSWTLTVTPADFSPQGWDGWSFALPRDQGGEDFAGADEDDADGAPDAAQDEQADSGRRPRLAGSGSFRLDSSSRAALSVATSGLGQCSPCEALLEVNLQSPDRQKLFVRGTTLLHHGQAYPGFHAAAGFAEVGKPYSGQVVVVDPDGRTLAGRRLSLKLVREYRQNVRSVGAFGRLEWRSEPRSEDAGHWDLVSGKAPLDWTFTPAQPGRYRLVLKAGDADGHVQAAAAEVYAAGKGEATWAQDDSEMLALEPDKAEYKPGETAHVLVKSPYAQATALVTLEREGVLQSSVRSVSSSEALDIPITEAMLPNVYVGVELVHGRAGTGSWGPDGEDLAKPQARFGYAVLKVVPQSRRLDVSVAADRAEYRPGSRATVDAQVRDWKGAPVQAELAVYAVDEGVLALTHYETPDPFAFFYGPRPLWISTSDNRLLVIGMRNFGEKGQNRGGGGGEAALAGMQGVDLRRRFESLAFWSGDLRTDAQGKAEASFELPDNLTRFRLIAVAAAGASFGSAETGMKVAKALVLRPSLPRFARLGDRFQAGVAVQNAGSAAGQVQVTAASTGNLALGGGAQQAVNLAPGEARELRWDFSAGALGEAVLGFKAAGQVGTQESDGLEWKLPVELPERREHAATSGVVDETAAAEALARPSNALSGTAALDLQLASTAMLGLKGGVGYLLDYPHLCLEQRLSKILPAVVGPDLLEAFHLGAPKEQLAAAQAVLDALPQFQDGSGGYRYWTDAYKPDAWLTAYALEVAALARDSGFKLPQQSLAQAASWLRDHYDRPDTWGYPYSDVERDVVRAWALYALSRNGVQLPGLYSQLYARRAELPLYSKADLLRVAAVLGTPGQRRELAQALLNQADVDPRLLHFEEPHADRMPWVHASTVAVTGFCTDALLSAQGGFAGDEKAVRWMLEARRRDGCWLDTQSNAWALMALTRYFRVHEKAVPDFTATVGLDGKQLTQAGFHGRSLAAEARQVLEEQLFGGGSPASLTLDKQGTGRLYYSLLLSWVPAKVDKADDEGFGIERAICAADGRPVQGALVAGRRYGVTLTVRTSQDRSFVALTDYLPAGCEIVDSSLATESQAAAEPSASGDGEDDPWGGWWGRFQRHENYDDRVQVYADFLSAGVHRYTYTVQATTPGSFSQPAAYVEMMYEPETYGRTADQTVSVEPAQP